MESDASQSFCSWQIAGEILLTSPEHSSVTGGDAQQPRLISMGKRVAGVTPTVVTPGKIK